MSRDRIGWVVDCAAGEAETDAVPFAPGVRAMTAWAETVATPAQVSVIPVATAMMKRFIDCSWWWTAESGCWADACPEPSTCSGHLASLAGDWPDHRLPARHDSPAECRRDPMWLSPARLADVNQTPRTVLVTGASKGIGAAIASHLAG